MVVSLVHMTCYAAQEDQQNLTQHFLDLRKSGSQWASELLFLTPCDLWPYMHNRTTWLVGDSITQVG